MTNQDIVTQFFEHYMHRDMEALKKIVAEDVKWYFLGRHKLAGVKNGFDELVQFFDTMGKIMGKSNPTVTKLIVAENKDYVIECQHIKTNRQDGINVEHDATVLWMIRDGKIVEGRHFFADPEAVDHYFNTVPIE